MEAPLGAGAQRRSQHQAQGECDPPTSHVTQMSGCPPPIIIIFILLLILRSS